MQGVGGTKDSAWPAKTMKVLEMFCEMFFPANKLKVRHFIFVCLSVSPVYSSVRPALPSVRGWYFGERKSKVQNCMRRVMFLAHRRWLHLIKEAVLPAEALFNCIHHRKRKYQFSFHWELRVLIISLNDIRHFLPVKWSGERCQWSFETEICFRRRRI